MIKKMRFFNMIEVLLALTVIAIGMTSVLGLFPVGLKASREAIAQNCSADVADQMITYLRVISEINQAQYAKAFYDSGSFVDDSTYITINNGKFTNNPPGSSNEQDVDDNSLSFLKAYGSELIKSNNKLEAGTINFKRVAPGWAVFKVDGVSNQPRVFFIVQGPNCTENDDDSAGAADKLSRTVDYSAMALVWKSPVQIWRDNPDGVSGWGKWPTFTEGTDPDSTVYKYSAKLNVELSWPLELPYAERKKRYYQIVINKPD